MMMTKALFLASLGLVGGNHLPTTVAALAAMQASGTHTVEAGAAPAINVPANALRIADIHKMSGWESCTVCAGKGGNGPKTGYRMEQFVREPSLSGASTRFSVGGTPWGAAIWWKQVGGNEAARHFVYEVKFLAPNPGASQALEFDVNQNAEGRRYIFGTECDLKGDHTWRVWNYTRGWVSTGKRCELPTPNQWHQVVWELERTTDGQTHFIAVTVDGVRQEINMYGPSYPAGGSGIDVAFQMDLDRRPNDYHVYLDDVTLTTW